MKDIFSSQSEIRLLNVWNLNNDEYSIEIMNTDLASNKSSHLRTLDEYNFYIENGLLKVNDSKTVLGTIQCKIIFKSVLSRLDGLFKNIKSLVEADFSGFKSDNIKNMNELFTNCKKLEKINFKDFNSKNVEYMDNTFEGCTKLVELDLSSFETPKLKSMKETFKNCENLEYLDITNFDLNGKEVETENIFEGADNIHINDNNSNIFLQLNINLNSTLNSTCKDGPSEKCQKCNQNDNKCEVCNDGYYLYISKNAKSCQTCDENCNKCGDTLFCTECKDGYKVKEIREGYMCLKITEDATVDESTDLLDYSNIEDTTNRNMTTEDITNEDMTNEGIDSETDEPSDF